MELIKPYTFDLDSHHKVLVVLDMQNATCIRHAGYGKALADAGEPDAQRAFFERVEKIVIPRQQQLPDYFATTVCAWCSPPAGVSPRIAWMCRRTA